MDNDDLSYIREAVVQAAEYAMMEGLGFVIITNEGHVFAPTIEELRTIIADLDAGPVPPSEIH
jgi:hypothetical protein